ncbi:hypothetical protein EMCRGX_G034384 [Ephydatia muelleri]
MKEIAPGMAHNWRKKDAFGDDKFKGIIEISEGDIFEGGPTADAIVSPANSFGFMDGGIDMAYSKHFGWQMQTRLQTLLREKYDGELPVGLAVIIPTYPEENPDPIKYLISAPTMRVPTDADTTVNAYLAFRATLRAVKEHNATAQERGVTPIKSILCPGLCTYVGMMPFERCAIQMRTAYEAVMYHSVPAINNPAYLHTCVSHNSDLSTVGDYD